MHVTKELSASLDYFRLVFVFPACGLCQIFRRQVALSLFPSANSCGIF
jgi:hypothetical protein